jgi:hypothetical protein
MANKGKKFYIHKADVYKINNIHDSVFKDLNLVVKTPMYKEMLGKLSNDYKKMSYCELYIKVIELMKGKQNFKDDLYHIKSMNDKACSLLLQIVGNQDYEEILGENYQSLSYCDLNEKLTDVIIKNKAGIVGGSRKRKQKSKKKSKSTRKKKSLKRKKKSEKKNKSTRKKKSKKRKPKV